MNQDMARELITTYVTGWRSGDVDEVLGTLTPDCTVIESHGPTYHGHELIRQWMTSWFGAGQTIPRWEITSMVLGSDRAAFEWIFTCTGPWGEATLDGASMVGFRDGRIGWLREYRCTEPPYRWAPPHSSR